MEIIQMDNLKLKKPITTLVEEAIHHTRNPYFSRDAAMEKAALFDRIMEAMEEEIERLQDRLSKAQSPAELFKTMVREAVREELNNGK